MRIWKLAVSIAMVVLPVWGQNLGNIPQGFVGNPSTSKAPAVPMTATQAANLLGLHVLPFPANGVFVTDGSGTQQVSNTLPGNILLSGGGAYTTPNAYTGGIGSSQLSNVKVTNAAIAPIVSQVIGSTSTVGGYQPGYAGIAIKNQNGNSYHAEGGFFECDDTVGWSGAIGGANNNFCEGSRSMAFLSNGTQLGSAYGGVSVAYTSNSSTKPLFMVGQEAEVDNLFADAPLTFNRSTFVAAFLATNGNNIPGVKKADAAFLINPFNETPFHKGFLCPQGSTAGSTVSYSCFQVDSQVTWGLQMENAQLTHGIGLPNNVDVRFNNAAASNDMSALYAGTDNTLRVGNDTNWAAVEISMVGVRTYINGPLTMQSIPTSCSGPQPTGTLWNNGGVVNVCP